LRKQSPFNTTEAIHGAQDGIGCIFRLSEEIGKKMQAISFHRKAIDGFFLLFRFSINLDF